MATLKQVVRSAKAVAKGYSDLELKVRQATCNDKWGPSSSLMHEICVASEHQVDGRLILEILDKRLNDSGKNWRHVFKSLTVYQYLLENGPEYIIAHAKNNLHLIKTLKEYQYVDENGNDHGQNVRVKSKEVSSLLLNEAKLKELRSNRGRSEFGSGLGAEDDDDLRRAIEASKEQATLDEQRRRNKGHGGKTQEDIDLQRAIELSEKEALEKRRDQLNSGKLVENDDILDFFGSIVEPQATQSFGGYDPFAIQQQQQQQMQQQYFAQQQAQLQAQQQAMWQQEQQRLMMEQQEQMRMQMLAQQQEQARLQMLAQQQQQQNAFAMQFQNHQHNPFAAAPVEKKMDLENIDETADLSTNPNALLDPFAKVSTSLNPSGPNTASVGGSTTQGSNPFAGMQATLANMDANGIVKKTDTGPKNPFSGITPSNSFQNRTFSNMNSSLGQTNNQNLMMNMTTGMDIMGNQNTGYNNLGMQGMVSNAGIQGMSNTGGMLSMGGNNVFQLDQNIQPSVNVPLGGVNPFGQQQPNQNTGNSNPFGRSASQNQFF